MPDVSLESPGVITLSKKIEQRPFVEATDIKMFRPTEVGVRRGNEWEHRCHVVAFVKITDLIGVVNIDAIRLANESPDEAVHIIQGYQRLQDEKRVRDIVRRLPDVDINNLLAVWGDIYINCRGLSVLDVESGLDETTLPAPPGGFYVINGGHRFAALQRLMEDPEIREILDEIDIPIKFMFYDHWVDEQMLFETLQRANHKVVANDVICGEEARFNTLYSGPKTYNNILAGVEKINGAWPVTSDNIKETAENVMTVAIISHLENNRNGPFHGLIERVKTGGDRHNLSEMTSTIRKTNGGKLFTQKHLKDGDDSLPADRCAIIIERFVEAMSRVWPSIRENLINIKRVKVIMSMLGHVSFLMCLGYDGYGAQGAERECLSISVDEYERFIKNVVRKDWDWESPENRSLIDKASQDFGRESIKRFFQDWAIARLGTRMGRK
jgi:hypothetical protein